jgi:cyclic pyranopterin phosphate synthase
LTLEKSLNSSRLNYIRTYTTWTNNDGQADGSNSNKNDGNDENKYAEQVDLWNEFASYYKEKRDINVPADFSNDSNTNLLTHFDDKTSRPKQVDISEKKGPHETQKVREASASGYIQLNQATFNALVNNELKKGNALIVAQLAGIQASKQTASLIPLCHQISLDVCDVDFKCDSSTNRVYCKTICKTSISKTGVEMEALTACSIALLTVYDMCKAMQKDAVINTVKLDYKYGGKSDYEKF